MYKIKHWVLNILFLLLGSMLTLSFIDINQCDENISYKSANSASSIKYVMVILSAPDNLGRRNAIRSTWLKLINYNFNSTLQNEYLMTEFKYYFVIGIDSLNTEKLYRLKDEQKTNQDLLFLPHLNDSYSELTEKLFSTISWIEKHHSDLLYMIKVDDDSFVRIDKLLRELKLKKIQAPNLKNSIYLKEGKGLYWGYFKGNAHVKKEGRWVEEEWFLSDRYLPYALGGGYIISVNILHFIAQNMDVLKRYKSEDVSVGVWTASLSNIERLHDIRFDTEWTSRGCQDLFLVRHKQTPENMVEMYNNLIKSHGYKICTKEYSIRSSYNYNWNTSPSLCCNK